MVDMEEQMEMYEKYIKSLKEGYSYAQQEETFQQLDYQGH
jgi:hypothetical protein